MLRLCYEVSERRVCEVLSLSRTSCRYRSRADEQAALRIRLRDLAYRPGKLRLPEIARSPSERGLADKS